MGCFIACFGSVDGRKKKPRKKSLPRNRSCRNYEPLQPPSSLKQTAAEEVLCTLPESRENTENLSFINRKKVTFDLNVNTYIEGINVSNSFEVEEDGERKEDDPKVESQKQFLSKEDSTTFTTVSFPSNHRYQNCEVSDEEVENDGEEGDDEYEDSDFEYDDDDDDIEESYESFRSMPVEMEDRFYPSPEAKKEVYCPEPAIASNGPRDRSQYVHPVLNPVENLGQWRAVKVKPTLLNNQKKENIDINEGQLQPFKQEILVNCSLSNWLVSTETTPNKMTSFLGTESPEKSKSQTSNSPNKYEDRPILGALTVEEIRLSASSSPRRSPRRNPDDIPIIGTVGSYWNHQDRTADSKGMQSTTRKYREAIETRKTEKTGEFGFKL